MLANPGAGIAEVLLPPFPLDWYLPFKGGRCQEQACPWANAAATQEIANMGLHTPTVTLGPAEGTLILSAPG